MVVHAKVVSVLLNRKQLFQKVGYHTIKNSLIPRLCRIYCNAVIGCFANPVYVRTLTYECRVH